MKRLILASLFAVTPLAGLSIKQLTNSSALSNNAGRRSNTSCPRRNAQPRSKSWRTT